MKKQGLFSDKKKTIDTLKCKYDKYKKYIYESFFDDCYYEFKKEYDTNEGIKPEICYSLFVKNKLNKILCDKVKKDDIDLEIDMIDQWMPILNILIRKMKINEELIDKELIIIDATQTYDGNILFSIHLLNILKNTINNKEVIKNDAKVLTLK